VLGIILAVSVLQVESSGFGVMEAVVALGVYLKSKIASAVPQPTVQVHEVGAD
jgi:hypothetical protein